jgi:hypothetical protein
VHSAPPPLFAPWQPPLQQPAAVTTNDRRVQAYQRHQAPMTTLAPFAPRGVAGNPFASSSTSSVSAPSTRRVTVSRAPRRIPRQSRQSQEYVLVIHPEPVSYPFAA